MTENPEGPKPAGPVIKITRQQAWSLRPCRPCRQVGRIQMSASTQSFVMCPHCVGTGWVS